MGLEQLNFEGRNRVEVAIERLRMFEPKEGYYLAFSGGKDSQAIYHLAKEAGVKFDAHFNFTTVDPPEVVKFIKEQYPDVEIIYPDKSMFQLVYEKGYPNRQSRFCCETLKEGSGVGRFTVTGVRWAESTRRKSRKMVEICYKPKSKNFLHPIIDWGVNDVWDYLNGRSIPHCSLYDEGFTRIGCILCPMGSPRQAQIELKRYPKIARAWRIAFERLWVKAHEREAYKKYSSSEEMWQWWLSRKGQSNKAQAVLFE